MKAGSCLFICAWASSVGWLYLKVSVPWHLLQSWLLFPRWECWTTDWWSHTKSWDSSDFPIQVRGMREELTSLFSWVSSFQAGSTSHAVKLLKPHRLIAPDYLQQAPGLLSQVSKDLPDISEEWIITDLVEPELYTVTAPLPAFLWPLNYSSASCPDGSFCYAFYPGNVQLFWSQRFVYVSSFWVPRTWEVFAEAGGA